MGSRDAAYYSRALVAGLTYTGLPLSLVIEPY
jgi:hypothetical protein